MIQLNLIPVAVQSARTKRRRVKRWGLAIAVWLAVLAVPVAMDAANRVVALELRGQREALNVETAATRAKVRAVSNEAIVLRGQVERARALRAKRAWSNMFMLFATCLSDRVWLTYVATDPPTPVAGGHRRQAHAVPPNPNDADAAIVMIEAPRKIVLRGYSVDHPALYAFMTQLNRSDVFAKVTLVRSAMEPVLDSHAVAFELSCEW